MIHVIFVLFSARLIGTNPTIAAASDDDDNGEGGGEHFLVLCVCLQSVLRLSSTRGTISQGLPLQSAHDEKVSFHLWSFFLFSFLF